MRKNLADYKTKDPFENMSELAIYPIGQVKDFHNNNRLSSSNWSKYVEFREGCKMPHDQLRVPVLYYNEKKSAIGYLASPCLYQDNINRPHNNQILLKQIQQSLYKTDLPPSPQFIVPEDGYGKSLSLSLLIYYIHSIYQLPLHSTWFFSGSFDDGRFTPAKGIDKKYAFCQKLGAKKFFAIEDSDSSLRNKTGVHHLPCDFRALIVEYLRILSEEEPSATMAYLFHLKSANKIPLDTLKKSLVPLLKKGSIDEKYYANFILGKANLHAGHTLKADDYFKKSKELYPQTLKEIKKLPISSVIPYDIALDQQAQYIIHQIDMGKFTAPQAVLLKEFENLDKKFTEYHETLPHLDLAWGVFVYKKSLARFLAYQGRWALEPKKIQQALTLCYYFRNRWLELHDHAKKISDGNNLERLWNDIADTQYSLYLFNKKVELLPEQKEYAYRYHDESSVYNLLGILQIKIMAGEKLEGHFVDHLLKSLLRQTHPTPTLKALELLASLGEQSQTVIDFVKKQIDDLYMKNGIEYLLVPRACYAFKLPFPKPIKSHYLNKYYVDLCKNPKTILLRTPY